MHVTEFDVRHTSFFLLFGINVTNGKNSRKGMLSVPLGEELLERVNRVARAFDKSTTQFVKELLDEKTKAAQTKIAKLEKEIRKVVSESDDVMG
jgi:hypothetical protein